MASMSDGSTTWSYTYDADGLRTNRTNGTDTYSYVYNGGSLSKLTKGSDTLYFTYDANGAPLMVNHNGTVYYYVTNLQGDVTAIVDGNGNTVADYRYNAWGNPIPETDETPTALETLNPLRYRGYVYDEETGLYYLQSRYYNPELGRFINADRFVSTGQGLLGNNMFAYCSNNSVSNIDPCGLWTMGISLGVNITAFLGASVSIGIFWDEKGNVDWQWSYAVPFVNNTNTIGALDVGIGLSYQYTNRDTVYELYGPASYVGASGGPSWYVGGDIISFADISDRDVPIDGVQITVGVGVGIDVHVVESYTKPVKGNADRLLKVLTFKEERLGKF